MNGRGRTAVSEETKTMSPRRRSCIGGHERPDQPVRADDGEVELAGEPLGVDLGDRPRRDRAGVGDHHLDVAERPADRLGERRDRVVVGEVERVHERLATVRADLAGDVLEPVGTPRAERDREAGLTQPERGGGADAGAGAGDDRGAALGLGVLLARHQRTSTRVGIAAKPRTLRECTRTQRSCSTSTDADPLDEAGQRDAGLEPGQVGAEAEVPAAAEGQDLRELVLVAEDVVVVGAGEDPLVAVGRARGRAAASSPAARPGRAARRPRAGSGRAAGSRCRSAASPRSTG